MFGVEDLLVISETVLCHVILSTSQAHARAIKMAVATRDSSRFAGVKTFSEKFSQPEVDAEGKVRKVWAKFSRLLFDSLLISLTLMSAH